MRITAPEQIARLRRPHLPSKQRRSQRVRLARTGALILLALSFLALLLSLFGSVGKNSTPTTGPYTPATIRSVANTEYNLAQATGLSLLTLSFTSGIKESHREEMAQVTQVSNGLPSLGRIGYATYLSQRVRVFGERGAGVRLLLFGRRLLGQRQQSNSVPTTSIRRARVALHSLTRIVIPPLKSLEDSTALSRAPLLVNRVAISLSSLFRACS
jgi:hypothetical protein